MHSSLARVLRSVAQIAWHKNGLLDPESPKTWLGPMESIEDSSTKAYGSPTYTQNVHIYLLTRVHAQRG